MAAAGCDVVGFTAAYEAAKAVLGIPALWEEVSALDAQIPGAVPAAGQMALYRRLAYTLRGETFWLARRAARGGGAVQALVDGYGPGTARLKKVISEIISPVERDQAEGQVKRLTDAGAPEALAREVAYLQPLTLAVDLVDLAGASSWSLENAARLYHQVGHAFAFDRLRAAAGAFTAGDSFERMAVRRLVEDLLAEQAALTRAIMGFAGSDQAGDSAEAAQKAIGSWAALRRETADAARRAIEDIEAASGGWSFAKLTIANAALRELAAAEATKKRRS
jgi:glutamate dehydrogenase